MALHDLLQKSKLLTLTLYTFLTLYKAYVKKGYTVKCIDKYFERFLRNYTKGLRPDAVKQCNKTLQDEDQRWRLSVVKEIGCIPAFERRFLVGSKEGEHLLETLPKCDNDGYRRHREDYSPFNNFEAATYLYTEPCMEMTSVVTTMEEIVYLDNTNMSSLVFKFNYEKKYRETINRQALGLADLWSQIGGLVGIFIGYSIIQIPVSIAAFYTSIKGMVDSLKLFFQQRFEVA